MHLLLQHKLTTSQQLKEDNQDNNIIGQGGRLEASLPNLVLNIILLFIPFPLLIDRANLVSAG